jgi:Carboxypeptidase regulatory-like domain
MTRLHYFLLAPVVGVALFIANSTPAFAQSSSGNVVGLVSDASGAGIPNVTITAINTATGVKTSTKGNSLGEYRLNNLLIGTYNIDASASGFTTSSVKDVNVDLNKTSTQNFTVQVGQTTTTVDVTESAAVIDTTTSQLQNTFDVQDARNLPAGSTGSGVLNFSLLGAGVASSGGLGYGSGPSIGGQRPTNNSFNIEGVDNNDKGVTGPIIFVPNDAVSQFSLLQNQFSPEFGFSSGGIFNTNIRSGANQLHGTLYEYMQNRNLNAVDQANARQGFLSNPRYDNNRLGANIGGKIIKNKLFYFADFEYNPIGQNSPPPGQIFAPTAAGYSTLGGLAAVSKTNLGVLQQYLPAAPSQSTTTTVAGVAIPIGAITVASPNFSNQYNLVASGDWNISDKDQFRLRYVYNKYSGVDVAASLPVFFSPIPNNVHLASMAEFHNFSPTLTNEIRIAYSRRFNNYPIGNFTFPGLDAFPNIVIDTDLNLQLGPDPNSPQGYVQNTYQGSDNATKILNKHTLKFGYDFHDIIASNTFVQRSRGDYNYSTLDLYLRDLSPDELGERSVGAAGGIPVGFLEHALYINDDYRFRPNITLNLGLRYEYVTTPIVSRAQALNSVANVPGVITFKAPASTTKDFAPRIGVAYSPGKDGKTSIRAGFGMSYDQFYNNLAINAKPPYYQNTIDVPDLNNNTPNFLKNGGIPGTVPPPTTDPTTARGNTSSYTFDQIRPYSLNWTLGVQHVFANDYTAEVRYVGTRGVHLQVQERLNITTAVTQTNNIPTFLSTPSAAQLSALTTTLANLQAIPNNMWAQYGFTQPVVGYAPWGNSTYHGLAMQLTRRFSKNLSFIGAYTWSHAIDDSTATVFSTYLTPRRGQDFQNLAADKGSSAIDRRQRFTFTANYDVPLFRQSTNWLVKNVVGNWNLAGTYTYETPELATVQSNVDANLNGDSAGDRFIDNPAGINNTSSSVVGVDKNGATTTAAKAIVAYVAVNGNAQYIKAGAGAYANGGKNTYSLNPVNNFDVSLMKRFSVTERIKFQLAGQFYNLMNHAQYLPGYTSDIQPRGFTSSRNFLIPGNPDFGHLDRYFPSNSRQIQIAAKFTF